MGEKDKQKGGREKIQGKSSPLRRRRGTPSEEATGGRGRGVGDEGGGREKGREGNCQLSRRQPEEQSWPDIAKLSDD